MFTDDELRSLIQLLDEVTKAGGLAAAERALPIALKAHKILTDQQNVDVQDKA